MNDNADDGSRERLLARIAALLWAVVIALTVTFFYFASSLCITILLAAFLAILAEPLVALLERLHLPRSASAALVIVLGMILVSATLYVFYDRGTAFYRYSAAIYRENPESNRTGYETNPKVAGECRQAESGAFTKKGAGSPDQRHAQLAFLLGERGRLGGRRYCNRLRSPVLNVLHAGPQRSHL